MITNNAVIYSAVNHCPVLKFIQFTKARFALSMFRSAYQLAKANNANDDEHINQTVNLF